MRCISRLQTLGQQRYSRMAQMTPQVVSAGVLLWYYLILLQNPRSLIQIAITGLGWLKIMLFEEFSSHNLWTSLFSENNESQKKNSFVGTAQYVSPEVLTSKSASKRLVNIIYSERILAAGLKFITCTFYIISWILLSGFEKCFTVGFYNTDVRHWMVQNSQSVYYHMLVSMNLKTKTVSLTLENLQLVIFKSEASNE